MRFSKAFLFLSLVLTASAAQAAVKERAVNCRVAIREDSRWIHEPRCQNYGFRMEIVDDSQGIKPETLNNGRPFVTAAKGERYSVRLYNPLPVRTAVNLTVDGLNSITGKPSGIADGEKWIIEPYSSIVIPGWQVSGGEARRFFFTNKPKSYAKWRGDMMGADLSANCGVIGAAYFWNQAELNEYYEAHPVYRPAPRPIPYSSSAVKASDAQAGAAPAMESIHKKMMREEAPETAGTGMGERESHPTYQVDFHYDTGMYSLDQALVIYYDFAKAPSPNPFPAVGFSPEMP
jgi:hypothetical protein